MTKKITLACALAFALSTLHTAQAGTSDQDPTIWYLRKTFTEAKTPTLDQLQLGKKWSCSYFPSIRDSFNSYVHTTPLHLVPVGAGILMACEATETPSRCARSVYYRPLATFTSNGFAFTSGTSVAYVRATIEGHLIIEIAVVPPTSTTEKTGEASIAHPGRVSTSYRICSKAEVKD